MIKIKQKLWKITAILSVCLLLAGCAQETPDRAGSSKTSEEKMDVSVEIRCDTADKTEKVERCAAERWLHAEKGKNAGEEGQFRI